MDEATHKKNFKPIILRDLFMDKNPKLGRWVPPFVFRALSRMLRIDFFNDPILYNHGYKKDVEFAQAMDNVRRINAIFESDEQVMTFPAGLVSRRKKGLIRDPEWQKSIIIKAKSSKRDLVPTHVSGRCSNFFYKLANSRKFLGIKTNLEMFFLPNESYQHKIKHFVITFGKPIPYETFDNRFTPLEWAQLVKDHVYIIAENPEKEFSYIKN